MEVTESLSEGLKRELKIVLAANELEDQLSARLDEIKGQVRLNGFRPGKVPVSHIRKIYGRSVMAEVVQQAVTDSSQKALDDRSERPAYQPEISLPEDQDKMESVIEGQADLSYTMAFEVVPDFDIQDFSALKLERPTTEVEDSHIDESIGQLTQQYREFEPRGEKDKAETGDRVIIDFVGTIEGDAFEGGSQDDAPLELGSNTFLPGFEDQLVGAKAGDEVTVEVTFPEGYGVEYLAGKPAQFAVTVKEVSRPVEAEINDEFANRLGFEDLAKMREAIADRVSQEFDMVSRAQLKRQLLDRLDEVYDFALPQRLVDQEFEQIWQQVTRELEQSGQSFEDEDTTEDEAREEYRGIAERRVRLGLVLGEIGDKSDVSVSDEEVNRALMERIRQFPGQEKQVYDYYQQNPQALLELRGPIFEQKVVDHIVEQADVTDKKVTKDELFQDPEDETEDKPKKASAKKKASGTKSAAKKPAAKKAASKTTE
ncbi:MAG: trigger factor [Hyphomicrobiales bacterium]